MNQRSIILACNPSGFAIVSGAVCGLVFCLTLWANAELRSSPGFHASHGAQFHDRRPAGFNPISQGEQE